MMIYLVVGLFFIYNYIVLSYTKFIFRYSKDLTLKYILFGIINLSWVMLDIFVLKMNHLYLIMLIYAFLYIIETRFLFREDWKALVFGMLCFVINFIGIRLIILSVFAMVSGGSIQSVIFSLENRILVSVLNFAIPVPYILMVKYMWKIKYAEITLTDNKNLKFTVYQLVVVFGFIFFNCLILTFNSNFIKMNLVQLMNGIIVIIMFLTALLANYFFSKLKLQAKEYDRLTEIVQEEKAKIDMLKEKAQKDDFTGLFIREIAVGKIAELVNNHKRFFVTFFDIDGLKFANDNFGHEEGDFYIKRVVNIINEMFADCVVSRYGGDEFLVVGESNSIYVGLKRTIACYEEVKKISKMYNKPYPTSVSYGLVNVSANDSILTEEILRYADQRMYKFKEGHNKQRKTNGFAD